MDFTDNFFDFEIKNGMFDITDANGVHMWDCIRYYVCSTLRHGTGLWLSDKSKNGGSFKVVTRTLKKITLGKLWGVCYGLLPVKRKYLFFLSSRNRMGKKFFDQTTYDALQVIGEKNALLYESRSIKDLVYKKPVAGILLFRLYKWPRWRRFSVEEGLVDAIFDNITMTFGERISKEEIAALLKSVYLEHSFYRWFFKYHGIKAVFLTQNGIQKGLFWAAKELGVPVYEMQHGMPNRTDPAYSYPTGIKDVTEKTMLPTKVFTLSPFWFSDFFCPIERVVLGNNYFASSNDAPAAKRENLLVISANLYGHALASLVKEMVQKRRDLKVKYKLHDNEFADIDYYRAVFSDTDVDIVRNESSVPDLLQTSRAVLTCFSTAVFEALQNAVPVFIYKISAYEQLSSIFGVEGLFLVDSADEAVEKLDNLAEIPRANFFSPFDRSVIEDVCRKGDGEYARA